MRKTHEELIAEIARLEQSNKEWADAGERRRKEFAKAFSWRKPQEMYSPRDNEPATPTWEQIFVEIGKLLAARTFYDLEGNVSELEYAIKNLEEKIKKEIHPNL